MDLSRHVGPSAQVALAIAGLAAAGLAPPERGSLLAVPLGNASAAEIINVALAQGAGIEGRGPWGDTVVLWGERDPLSAALRAHGVVLLAASPELCRR